MKRVFYATLFCLLSQPLFSQELPNLPPSIKWQQINSDHFRIIYPKYLESEAQRTANILENIYEPASESLGANPRVYSIILQSEHAVANGFVTIAPYHSEFFNFAPQSYRRTGNDEWLPRLAVHEYRHMVQFEKAITPFNKFLYFLFGEYGPGMAAAGAVPNWFFEGDAVGIETAMGRTGRGRTPSFMMAFKANLIEKGEFNYYKQYLTSYRDNVPNHYVTGYLMTTHLKNHHGADILDKVVGQAFRRPYIPFTFSNSLKKYAGNYLVPTYEVMLEEQKELFTDQLNKISPTTYQQVSHESNNRFTNYLLPKEVFDGNILAVKAGMSDINQFVLLDKNGNETKLLDLGSWVNSDVLSATDTEVVWAERELDMRWQMRTYTVIKKLDLKTKKITRLTKKTKYVSPAISPNGKYIAAIDQSTQSQYEIHLLNAEDGQLIKSFDNPSNAFYSMPSFDDKSENIIVLKHKDEGKAIVEINIESGLEEELYFSDKENLGAPIRHGDKLFFASDVDGIDNIYAINLSDGTKYQVTSSKYGAFSPSVKSNKLIYNDFSVDGHQVAIVTLDPSKWKKADEVEYVGFNFQQKMVEQEDKRDILYDYPDSTFESKKYNKLGHVLRPHSWLINPIENDREYSATIYSKDILNTTRLSAGAFYNQNEKTWRGEATVSYQAFYPIIDMTVGYGNRGAVTEDNIPFKWTENNFNVGVRVPFYLTNSRYIRNANLGISHNYIFASNYQRIDGSGTSDLELEIYALSYNASFQRLLRKSKLDLNSKWGQTLAINYNQTPFGGNLKGELFSAETNLYFPGIFKHHSFHMRGGFQMENNETYAFSSPIRYTRGYDYQSFDQFINLSVNYKLPLLYMDWHLGPVLNIQRIYTNVFYDQGIGRDAGKPDDIFYSVGAEVSFNINVFRLLPLIDIGVRYSYLPDTGNGLTEIVFGGIQLIP